VVTENVRPIEPEVQRDFSRSMSYGDYLALDQLLSAQHPRSEPPQHDELLFIVQHQTSELWLKLLLHELRSARSLLTTDDLAPALKRLARVKRIQEVLIEQWGVLATLTPSEYAQIRPFLATSSGFQSWQYRAVEFLLGNKNVEMVRVFLPNTTNETRLIAGIDANINKIIDLGFLRRLRGTDDSYEVRRIIKAFVDGQWLADFEARLADYRAQLAGDPEEDD